MDSWMLPVAINRIPFGENKMQFSVSQIAPIFKKVPKDSIGLCMGDSAYSCNKFVQPLYKIDNVVTITRARRNKAIYKKYIDKKIQINGYRLGVNRPRELCIPSRSCVWSSPHVLHSVPVFHL